MKDSKIVFGGFDCDDDYPFCLDGVHFRHNEFRLTPSAKNYCFKSNECGSKFEFACAIHRPAIVWMNGPFQASVHDITMFRGGNETTDKKDWDRNALYWKMEELGEGKKGIGDGGYAGEPEKILVSKPGQSRELQEFLARAKNCEETLHTRFKSWNVLQVRFRHGKGTKERFDLHGDCVTAIAVITQYDFENGRTPFEVR